MCEDRLCSVDGCGLPVRSKYAAYCERHYYRLRRNGTLLVKQGKSDRRDCLHCGKPLSETQYTFCSKACQTRHSRGNPPTITCIVCGSEFAPRNHKMNVCSPECKAQRRRDTQRARYHRRMISDPVFRAAMWAAYTQRRGKLTTAAFVVYDYIYERDGYTCQLCGKPIDMALRWPDPMSPSIDHKTPLARGGEHSYENCQAAHLSCNASKGARVESVVEARKAARARGGGKG